MFPGRARTSFAAIVSWLRLMRDSTDRSFWSPLQRVSARRPSSANGCSFERLGVCWVSLDEGDNEPVRFLRYLAAALHRITPRASETVLALSQASSSPPLPAMLGVLINDLVQLPQASVLVFDDYHVIRERSIHEAIAFLLDHMPLRFHLLIATREEPPLPLARLRGRNAVAELGQADLRFHTDEVTTFLQGWLGLIVSPADVRALEARTEGWITGLQLAVLSMQKHADVAGFLTAFGGSDRHVLDYLVEEVLDRQPGPVQDFLLRTSILDRFCGPLCDAVMGLPGGGENGRGKSHQSLDILCELERANLFLVPLDAVGHWYPYHQLFADMLRGRPVGPSDTFSCFAASPDTTELVPWLE